jgi:hypothetical protein
VVIVNELVYRLLQYIQAMTIAKGYLLACLRFFFERYYILMRNVSYIDFLMSIV